MTRQTTTAIPPNEPWAQPWPAEDLETVGHCPVCGAASRKLLHADLVDNAFRTAPGKWALWTCAKCRSAYLDPRPSRDSIHRAYANYYTHQAGTGKDDYKALSPFRKLRRRLVNGYTEWRYSSPALPSNSLGVVAALIFPSLRRLLDHQFRHLPRLPKDGGKLLDVGCGAGSFLILARASGWDVVGLDPDPEAVAQANKQGLKVFEGAIEYFDGKSELFDVITLNHVIEHVHDPVRVLESCHALLKPGGQLWLETPNIESIGHARYKKSWRGLEAPRHLAIFNQDSLRHIFQYAGFPAPKNHSRPSPCGRMFQTSHAMSKNQSPYGDLANPITLRASATLAVFVGTIFPSRREFLTVSARKAVR